MAITVRNALELPGLKDFKLAAGRKGLENPVEKTGIVDYEFAEGFLINPEGAFERNSFVISSLLFAKDNEQSLFGAIESLIGYGVSALGIKTVFFKELPESVKKLADRAGLAVFLFDNAYFEDIIADLRQAIESDRLLGYEEERLQRLFHAKLSPQEVQRLGTELHPTLRKWVWAYSCKTKAVTEAKAEAGMEARTGTEAEDSRWEQTRILSRFSGNKGRNQDTAAFYFDRGFLFFVSQDTPDEARAKNQLSDVLHYGGIDEKSLLIGQSCANLTENQLDIAVKEAIYTRRAAQLMGKERLSYREAGILSLLLWDGGDDVSRRFAKRYLEPLEKGEKKGDKRGEQSENADFFRTAEVYVREGGSIPETARQLFVHENTVRYRIGKMRERLDPGAGEYTFFQNLSAAVWITLAEETGVL